MKYVVEEWMEKKWFGHREKKVKFIKKIMSEIEDPRMER